MKNITETKYFDYLPERRQNPYTGFLSFQRFDGDPLYSDCVVKESANMCETENFECYPVPPDVEQKGEKQGFYPDSSTAYIRFLWKEFEPKRGEYNYGFIEDILKKAKSRGQKVILRLMPHSTRARDDVPEWLKTIVNCPERPDGKRVKDSPTDPLFTELFLKAVKKIGEKFDGDSALYAMDISLPGAWGEGYKLELYADGIFKDIADVYTGVFKNTMLFGQLSKPELLEYANKFAPTGWRGDGFGNPFHMETLYPPEVEKVKDLWKKVPVSFESYWWLGEWKRQGWNVDEIIQKSLEWHISSFNGKSLPIPFEWKDKITDWVRKMGYHYKICGFTYPEKICDGEKEIDVELMAENVGVAPIYTKLDLYIKLKGKETEYVFKTEEDIRNWLPGACGGKYTLELPDNLKKGKYILETAIGENGIPAVYWCTNAKFDNGWYELGTTEII